MPQECLSSYFTKYSATRRELDLLDYRIENRFSFTSFVAFCRFDAIVVGNHPGLKRCSCCPFFKRYGKCNENTIYLQARTYFEGWEAKGNSIIKLRKLVAALL